MTIKDCFTKTLKLPYIQVPEETASFAYIEDFENETLYIYFECSNGATDWKNNFDFFQKPYKKMKHTWYVHRGFLKVWKVIEPMLEPHIKSKKFKKIFISGYSHGAAIAGLCHEYCVFNRPDIKDDIVTFSFESPRFVWGHMCKEIKERFDNLYVFRNGRDLVTHVPPVLFGFKHVGNLIKIGSKKYGIIQAHTPNIVSEALDCEIGSIEIQNAKTFFKEGLCQKKK